MSIPSQPITARVPALSLAFWKAVTTCILLLASIFAGSVQADDSQSPSTPREIYLKPGILVPVEGARRLNLQCLGHGTPVVVFEAGGWDSMMAWRLVQGPVSRTTTACAYDRAGLGFSDPAQRPSNAQNIVDDLERLLKVAGIQRPVVLVGHSAGGLYATMFASQHRAQVAGLVLVDPSFAQQDVVFNLARTPQDRKLEEVEIAGLLADVKRCVAMAHAGTLTPDTKDPPLCLRKTEDPILSAELARQLLRPQTQDAMLSEGESMSVHVRGDFSIDFLQAEQAIHSLDRMPLIVLTRGNAPKSPKVSQGTYDGIEAAWKMGHDRLAELSSRGESLTVSGTNHHIQLNRPDAVIDAVRRVIATTRAEAMSF